MPHAGQAGSGWRDPSLATAWKNPIKLRSHATPARPACDEPTEPRPSGCLQPCPLRQEPRRDVSPQSHQQLSGEGDGGDLAHAPLGRADTLGKPTCQGTVRLVAQPEPGKLNHALAQQ